MAAQGAVRMRENTIRQKYARYIKRDPQNPDRKRTALCAVAATVARVAHGLIKTGTDYRPYGEAIPPSGALRSLGSSRQRLTSSIMLRASTGMPVVLRTVKARVLDLVS